MSKIFSRDLPCLSSTMLCSVVAALLKVICNSKTGNQDRELLEENFENKSKERCHFSLSFISDISRLGASFTITLMCWQF